MTYHPPRQREPLPSQDPLEVSLVFNVRPCGTCSFFWPDDPARQPYGPYTAYDFPVNTPALPAQNGADSSTPWLEAVTRPPVFPNAQVMDGCRKAPIMTIGINPNLTAFAPGRQGASWCYPDFSSDHATDAWTKYAYYYRYRTVYQEHLSFEAVRRFLDPQDRIVAKAAGVVTAADRNDAQASFTIKVRFDGEAQDTSIPLTTPAGAVPYCLLFDVHPPSNRFTEGDVIAGRLRVPVGEKVDVYAGLVGYYEQFVPTLGRFQAFLRANGHPAARLRMGEDVCQQDMVACASPHWGPPWLGGANLTEQTIIGNCVSKNAWAIKQLVQTRPVVLFLVGEASYLMFRQAFGKLIKATPGLPVHPEDGAFSLLRATAAREHPCQFEFSTSIGGTAYRLSTRLVVTPHFSYTTNFLPQFRFKPNDWQGFQQTFPECVAFLNHDPRFIFVPTSTQNGWTVIQLPLKSQDALADLKQKFPAAGDDLARVFYDPHAMMARVLEELYQAGSLRYADSAGGGYLTRTAGPCTFCANTHWTFPLGCPYGKPEEPPLPPGFLDQVTKELLAVASTGAPLPVPMPSLLSSV